MYIVNVNFTQNYFLFNEKLFNLFSLVGIDMECKDVRSLIAYWHTATDQSSEFTLVVVVADLGSLTGNI